MVLTLIAHNSTGRVGKKTAQAGFTFIEVLVAALIMAIGLLGISTMQTRSLQYNQQAYLASQATILVNDMAEKMRSNSEIAEEYEINFFEEGSSSYGADRCIDNPCTSSEIVQWDLRRWKQTLARSLPGGDGEISPAGGVGEYTITARFIANRGDVDDDDFDADIDAYSTVTINVSL